MATRNRHHDVSAPETSWCRPQTFAPYRRINRVAPQKLRNTYKASSFFEGVGPETADHRLCQKCRLIEARWR